MFPVDAGRDPETLRRHTLKIAAGLRTQAATKRATAPAAIIVTLESTFMWSCEDDARHLEVRIGNVEAKAGRRQVFGAVAKAGTNLGALIRRSLDSVGRTDGTTLTALTDGCPGLRVGTARTEGTANFLVNRPMNKSQQMRWSRRGADLLRQVRCAVYNGTLGSGFGQRFHAANDPYPQAAIAACPPVSRQSLSYSESGPAKLLHALDLWWQTPQRQHPESDAAGQAAFKKSSDRCSTGSPPSSRRRSGWRSGSSMKRGLARRAG
jgi:Winged helix-turn helix